MVHTYVEKNYSEFPKIAHLSFFKVYVWVWAHGTDTALYQSGFLEVFKMALCCPPTYPTWGGLRETRVGRRRGDERLPILGIINPVNFPSEFFSCVNDASDLFAIMPILLCAWSRETSLKCLTIFFNFSPHPV